MRSEPQGPPQGLEAIAARLNAVRCFRHVRPTCFDLFSGAGGFSEGFRRAGWRILGGIDADRSAAATYRLNFPKAIFFEGEIADLSATALLEACGLQAGELGCLIGGPPCQSFSFNNHGRTVEGSRAQLFKHYLRIVEGTRPQILVMENVPGILSIGGGSVVAEIVQGLADLGYAAALQTLSAEEFGAPQIRKRVFIIASRLGAPEALFPKATHLSARTRAKLRPRSQQGLRRAVTVGQAIGDLPPIGNGGGEFIAPYVQPKPMSRFQRSARKGMRLIFNHICHRLGEKNLKRIEQVPEGGNWRHVPTELLPAGMQRARLSDHTKRYGRLSRAKPSSTILTKCDPHWGAYIHPTEDRAISVREAARLQGFADSFCFAGHSLTKHYEQIGNAVPVPVAEAIGRNILLSLRQDNGLYEKSAQLDLALGAP